MKKIPIILITALCSIAIFSFWNKDKGYIYGDIAQVSELMENKEEELKKIDAIQIKSFPEIRAKIVTFKSKSEKQNEFFVSDELIKNSLVFCQSFETEDKSGFTICNLKNRTILYLIAPKKNKSKQKIINAYRDSIMQTKNNPQEIYL